MSTPTSAQAMRIGLWLSLLLAVGCATREPILITALPLPEPAPVLEPPPHPVSDGDAAPLDSAPAGLWTSLAAGRVLTECEYAPGIAKWTRLLAGYPDRFGADMHRLAPWIDWVWREGQALGLPAEAALLPLVESGYRPVIGGFGAPGGWWQLMPATARTLGLRVDQRVDQRMDPLPASLAALGMLRQLGERFEGNWILALIAYNVGPLHVERWLARAKLSAHQVERVEDLPVPAVTKQHIHRLMAFGCIIAEPEKYGVSLVELSHRDQLSRVMLKQDVPPAAIPAAIGGERGEEWRRQNPQPLKRSRLEAGMAILAPADLLSRIAALGDLERYARRATATASGSASERTASATSGGRRHAVPAIHRVGRGDSLWLIARRYDLRVRELLALNPGLTRTSVLQLGQRIKLR